MAYSPITLDEAAKYLRKNLIPEKMCSSGVSIWVVNTNWENDPNKVTPEAVIVSKARLYDNLSWQISLRLGDIISKGELPQLRKPVSVRASLRAYGYSQNPIQ